MHVVSAKEPVSERINSNVQLTCIITDQNGWTNYSASWYRDGYQIGVDGGRKYSVEDTDSGSVLNVRHVRESDIGLYQCAITLGSGPARRTFKHVVNLFCTYTNIFVRENDGKSTENSDKPECHSFLRLFLTCS